MKNFFRQVQNNLRKDLKEQGIYLFTNRENCCNSCFFAGDKWNAKAEGKSAVALNRFRGGANNTWDWELKDWKPRKDENGTVIEWLGFTTETKDAGKFEILKDILSKYFLIEEGDYHFTLRQKENQ